MSSKLRDHPNKRPNFEEEALPPNVSKLINSCKSQQMEYRILKEGEVESKENNRRMTIVINDKKQLVKSYYG